MEWEVTKENVAREIVSMASKADRVLLAPDPDREGEAIAWHISELLRVHFLQINISASS
jgi:DNA topoisomerase I